MIEFNAEALKDIINVAIICDFYCSWKFIIKSKIILVKVERFSKIAFLMWWDRTVIKNYFKTADPEMESRFCCCCRGDGYNLVMFILLWPKRETNMPNLNPIHGPNYARNCQ